jgi:hypothetical protein
MGIRAPTERGSSSGGPWGWGVYEVRPRAFTMVCPSSARCKQGCLLTFRQPLAINVRASGAASTRASDNAVRHPAECASVRPTQLSFLHKAHTCDRPSHRERNGRANLLFVDHPAYAVVRRSSETQPRSRGTFFAPLDSKGGTRSALCSASRRSRHSMTRQSCSW